MKLPPTIAWQSPSGNIYPSKAHAVANGEQVVTPLCDRTAMLKAVAGWLKDPEGAATFMTGWAIEQRMAGAMLLVQCANKLRDEAREAVE